MLAEIRGTRRFLGPFPHFFIALLLPMPPGVEGSELTGVHLN